MATAALIAVARAVDKCEAAVCFHDLMKRPVRQMPGRGFSLVELMIAVAVVAVLAAVAYPSYQQYVTNSWRAKAAGCLTELAQGMERRFTANMSYAGLINEFPPNNCIVEIQGATPQRYQFSFAAAPTDTAFILRAIPQGVQAANDNRCGTMTLNQAGVKTVSVAGADPSRCL